MRVIGTGTQACLLGSALLFSCPGLSGKAEAHQTRTHSAVSTHHAHQISTRFAYHGGHGGWHHGAYVTAASWHGHYGRRGYASHSWGISCVPYARQVSGIMVAGNAWQWWDNAAGEYARGDRPESGSVLNFRANGRMPLGHVAVVTEVVNQREIVVDQANWGGGGVSHNVAVVDVSEANNWSAVRVALGGRNGEFGSVYPTYGFIYNRPDNGMVLASVNRPAPRPDINPAPSDLRPVAERGWHTFEEVAESPQR